MVACEFKDGLFFFFSSFVPHDLSLIGFTVKIVFLIINNYKNSSRRFLINFRLSKIHRMPSPTIKKRYTSTLPFESRFNYRSQPFNHALSASTCASIYASRSISPTI